MRQSAGSRLARIWRATLLTAAILGQGGAVISGERQTAPPVQTLPPLAVTQLEERQLTGDLDRGTITLRFSEPMPVRELLLFLFRETPFSVVVDPGVEGSFLGELKDVTHREALDLILHPLGLDYSVQGTTIRVFERRPETRFFEVNYGPAHRTARRVLSAPTSVGAATAAAGAGAGEGPGAGGGSVSEMTVVEESDFFRDIASNVGALLSERGRSTLDRQAGLLQVTDYPERLDRVSLYLETVLQRARRQVHIQAQVIEVSLRDEFAAGIDWLGLMRFGSTALGGVSAFAPILRGGMTVGVKVADVGLLLQAFSSQGEVNVLSSPRIVAMNNEPAMMQVGRQDVFFLTTSTLDPKSGRIVRTSALPHTVTEGIVLGVTPQIGADGAVTLSISPRVTERTGEATSPFGDVVPILSVRESETLVRVYEGETAVISGLMQNRSVENEERVPVLGDIPLLGRLFRRVERSSAKTDLVILLTPTLVSPRAAVPPGGVSPATELRMPARN